MFLRFVGQSIRRAPRRKAMAIGAVALGSAVATAMLGAMLDVGDRVNRELRSMGANLIVTPKSASLPVDIGGIRYQPAAGMQRNQVHERAALARELRQPNGVLDAVVHAACDFNTDMAAIDRRLLDVLLPALAVQPNRPALRLYAALRRVRRDRARCAVRAAVALSLLLRRLLWSGLQSARLRELRRLQPALLRPDLRVRALGASVRAGLGDGPD